MDPVVWIVLAVGLAVNYGLTRLAVRHGGRDAIRDQLGPGVRDRQFAERVEEGRARAQDNERRREEREAEYRRQRESS